MKKVFIKAISYYLPESVLSNQDLAGLFPRWPIDKVASKIGISRRHIAGEEECASDLAFKAAEKLFSTGQVKPDEIDYILFCTESPDYMLPTTACVLQDRLNIPTTAGALDFNLGCSGYVYGLSLAKGLICGGMADKVLLLTSETYTKYIHPEDRSNRAIFGDGASASLISTDGFAEILNFSFGTDGSGYDKLIVRTRGARFPNLLEDEHTDEDGNIVSSDHLFMDGPAIFNFTLKMVPVLVRETLTVNQMELADINLHIFHQANKYMLEFIRKKIRIEPDCFYYCLDQFGNTVSSTVPIAICEAKREDKLYGNVLLAGFGVGYSWGGVVIST